MQGVFSGYYIPDTAAQAYFRFNFIINQPNLCPTYKYCVKMAIKTKNMGTLNLNTDC